MLKLKQRRKIYYFYLINIFKKYEFKWVIYRFITRSVYICKLVKLWAIYYYITSNINITIAKLRSICLLSGRQRGVLNFFYLSRLSISNQLAYNYFNNLRIQ